MGPYSRELTEIIHKSDSHGKGYMKSVTKGEVMNAWKATV